MITVNEWRLRYNQHHRKNKSKGFKPLTSNDYIKKRLKPLKALVIGKSGYIIDPSVYDPKKYNFWVRDTPTRTKKFSRKNTLYLTDNFFQVAEILMGISSRNFSVKTKYVFKLKEVKGMSYPAAYQSTTKNLHKLEQLGFIESDFTIQGIRYRLTRLKVYLDNNNLSFKDWCLYKLDKKEAYSFSPDKIKKLTKIAKIRL